MIKAVFFDIDGTLVSFRTHAMSEETVSYLERLKEKGIKTFIASGRTILTMDNLSGFQFDGYVTMNGALVMVSGKVISRTPIDRTTAEKIAETADRERIPCVANREDVIAINMTNEETERAFRMIRMPEIPVISAVEMVREPVYQFTLFADSMKEKELFLPIAENLEPSRWNPAFMDFNPKGLTKADGIGAVIRHLRITREETMAFGDGGNDIDMLRYAGIGVAMGNAEGHVKQAADHVTATVDEDGIGKALRHFGILQ